MKLHAVSVFHVFEPRKKLLHTDEVSYVEHSLVLVLGILGSLKFVTYSTLFPAEGNESFRDLI